MKGLTWKTSSNDLLALRAKHGADTPVWATHESQTFPWMIKRQMKRIRSAIYRHQS
jgi:hypothetical protein